MSEEGRPRRDIERVNYAEPGDDPEQSALEPSTESADASGASIDTTFCLC